MVIADTDFNLFLAAVIVQRAERKFRARVSGFEVVLSRTKCRRTPKFNDVDYRFYSSAGRWTALRAVQFPNQFEDFEF
jgi:hypothetical protein